MELGIKYKTAICNEMFGDLELSAVCDMLNVYGFEGLEIAPFTFTNEKGRFSPRKVQEIRSILEAHNIAWVGFHWLLAHPKGLHITSEDKTVRTESINHLKHLLNIAGELGGGNLIFGSPKQRRVARGKEKDGLFYFEEALQELNEIALSNNSIICLEALPSANTNILNTLEDVKNMVDRLNTPSISSMFDFHNCGDETLPWDELISHYYPIIKHVHLNVLSGDHPTTDDVPEFQPAFSTLVELDYSGWVSLEIFTIPADSQSVLKETRDFLNKVM